MNYKHRLSKKCGICTKLKIFSYDVERGKRVVRKCRKMYEESCLLSHFKRLKKLLNNIVLDSYFVKRTFIHIHHKLYDIANLNRKQ